MSGAPPLIPDIRVVSPASSANLGPGFDTLAVALELRNTIDVWHGGRSGGEIIGVAGEGEDILDRDDQNMVLTAMRHLADEAGRSLPSFSLRLHNTIPLGRGLGSSAAAIAGGLVMGAALLGLPGDPESLLPLALDLENHPDNVAAALWGGFTIGVLDGAAPCVVHLQPLAELRAVLLVPAGFSSTLESRKTLPGMVSRADAIFNAGRCALLSMALASGRLDLLGVAMQDRLHQPRRAEGFPYLDAAIAAALGAGAHGAALSGAGSSVIALVTGREHAVAAALRDVACEYDISAETMCLPLAVKGAQRVEVG
jgi:homoserine kinase